MTSPPLSPPAAKQSHTAAGWGILAIVILTRIPFLFTGYGADGDAWRVASVARSLWETGRYEISRPPGYPLHEILSAPFVGLGGSWLSNTATLLASLALLWIFYRIVMSRTAHPVLLTGTLALTPLLWINSAATMDYVWSLLFVLFALYLILRQRTWLAGVSLGIAIGFRLTNAVALVPLAVLLLTQHDRRGMIQFLLSACTVAALSFAPVILAYGASGWYHMIRHQIGSVAVLPASAFTLFVYRSVYAIGPAAVLAAAWGIFTGRKKLMDLLRRREALLLTAVAGIAAFLVLFLLFPLEKSYLLPAIPFLLILLDRISSRTLLTVFAACTVLFGFLNTDAVRHEGIQGTVGFNLRQGMVLEEWQKRQYLFRWREDLAGHRFESNTVVMTGVGPAFWFENPLTVPIPRAAHREADDTVVRQKADSTVWYMPVLKTEELQLTRDAGYRVVCDASHREYIEAIAGYSMREENIPLYAAPR